MGDHRVVHGSLEHVSEGKNRQCDFPFRKCVDVRETGEPVVGDVLLGQLHALGLSGGAGGVDQGCHVLGIHPGPKVAGKFRLFGDDLLAPGDELIDVDGVDVFGIESRFCRSRGIGEDRELEMLSFADDFRHLRIRLAAADDDGHRLGFIENELQVLGAAGFVQRNIDQSGNLAGKVDDGEGQSRWHAQDQSIASFKTGVKQGAGCAVGAVSQFVGGEAAFTVGRVFRYRGRGQIELAGLVQKRRQSSSEDWFA